MIHLTIWFAAATLVAVGCGAVAAYILTRYVTDGAFP